MTCFWYPRAMRACLALALALPVAVFGACSSSSDTNKASQTGGGAAGTSSSSGAGGSGGGAGVTGELTANVTRYDYSFDLPTRAGHSKLTLDVAAPGGDCWTVGCGLPATNVTWNGAPAASDMVSGGTLHACGPSITAGAPLALGADETLVKKTFFSLDVGYSEKLDMAGGTFSYMLSWVGGCERFGPCDADPSKLAEFHVEVKHPTGTVALCPGARVGGATSTQCDVTGTLAPTYSAFALATDTKWVRTPFLTVNGTDFVFFEVPGGKLAKTLEPASVTTYVKWITKLLGPLPYGTEMRYAGGPTKWLGFEHPANVIMLEDLPDQPMAYANPTMHVFMHETVHQWAGDRATIATSSDFVWKEATAEYLSYVFEDENRPPNEAAASLAYWDSVSLQSAHYPRPTDDPPPAVQTFYGDVYGPGPMVLYVQLETMLGRDKVLAGIAAFLSQAGAKTVKDLEKALETASGKDLAAYFDAWVFGTGAPEWPTFMVATSQTGNQVTVTLTQANASKKVYGCAVEVEVQGATQSATALVDFGVAPASAAAVSTVMLSEPVVSHVIDPKHRVVDKTLNAVAGPKMKVWIL